METNNESAVRPAYPQEIIDILEAALADDKKQQLRIADLQRQLAIANAENTKLWTENDQAKVTLNRQKELVEMIHTQLGNMAFNLNQSPNFIMDGVVRSLDSVMVYSKKALEMLKGR